MRTTEREVLNYNDTLVWLNGLLEKKQLKIDLKFILEVHKRTMNGLLGSADLGKLRHDAVFVNDPRLRKTVYWPPDQKDVKPLLNRLISFLDSEMADLDPILIAGIFHKEFVVIHPFIDGNGRTVRLVTKPILARLGINTFSLFSFEKFYNNNVTNYFSMVLTRDQQKIIDFISQHGFIKDSDYEKVTKRAKATRTLDFNKLIRLGLITRLGKGKSTYYKLVG